MDRVIYLQSEVDQQLADSIISKLLEYESQNMGSPITIIIDSRGGCVYAGLGILDAMEFISSPVRTVCEGTAAGISALILAAGEKGHRIGMETSKIILTGLSPSIDCDLDEFYSVENEVFSKLSKYLNKERHLIYSDVTKATYGNKIFSAREALDYGVIDRIYGAAIFDTID